jgi:threonine/homoserine/homoserine lactone efflux protein
MAWKLINAEASSAGSDGRPFTFIEAALFQAVNPKIWAIALAASAAFPVVTGPIAEALRLGFAFSSVNLFVCLFWTFCGTLLAALLSSPHAWHIFQNIMATFLVASAGIIWI